MKIKTYGNTAEYVINKSKKNIATCISSTRYIKNIAGKSYRKNKIIFVDFP